MLKNFWDRLLWKKRPHTLKERTILFWDWYVGVSRRFSETIGSGQCASLSSEVSAKIDELFPGFAWVFGPGKDKQGHSLTLTGEGVLHRQLIAIYWASLAPEILGWSFYASRQPGEIANCTINIGGRKFDPAEFWVNPSLNADEEKVDITVWHPFFNEIGDKEKYTVLFLFLDELFGEYGTQNWIGEIHFEQNHLADAMPITELVQYIQQAIAEKGWKNYPPGESWSGYHFEHQHDDFPRGDIIAGSTSNVSLLNEYLESKGDMPDPLAGTGADYIYISFDSAILPKGGEVAARGEIEDALEERLGQEKSGRMMGGAFGTSFAYIDLMIFDGENSLQLVQQVLSNMKLPQGTEIRFFAREKQKHVIVL